MPGSIRSMHVEHVFRDVQTDRGSLLHGRLLRWQFDTATLAHRCRRGASTPSPSDTDEVSVMRVDWIGADACKRHSRALENPNENKVYRGLAILSAKQIRDSGAGITDTREIFAGHADIRHGIVPRKGEPPPPEESDGPPS